MKRIVALSVLAFAACAAEPESAPTLSQSLSTPDTPSRWFVELKNAPTADGGDPTALAGDRAAFRAAAKQAKLNYTERYAYQSLFNGFSVELSSASVGALERIPGVQRVYPVHIIDAPAPALVPDSP